MAVAMLPIGPGRDLHGRPAMLRPEAAIMWAAAADLVRLELGIDLDARILQAAGDAKASAGVHLDGAAVDIRVWELTHAEIRAVVLLLRECGFAATWFRPWPGNQHIHAAAKLRGIWTRASYQVVAVEAGFDGTGRGGRGALDPDPRPDVWRDHITGPAWAAARIAALTAPKEIYGMTTETEYRYTAPQKPANGAYVASHPKGWWRLDAPAGPVVVTVSGYATGGPDTQLFIRAEKDLPGGKKSARDLGRCPLPNGRGSFAGAAVAVLETGETIRLRVGGKSITLHNITTRILHT